MFSNRRSHPRAAAWLAVAALGWLPLAADAASLELRSILLDDQGVMFSIHDTTANTAYWLSPGQGNQNLRVLEYDDIQHEVVVQRGDETVRLKLSGASIRDSGIDDTGSPLGSNGLVADVNPLNPRLGVALAPMANAPTSSNNRTVSSTNDQITPRVHRVPPFKRRLATDSDATTAGTVNVAAQGTVNRGLNPRLWNPSS